MRACIPGPSFIIYYSYYPSFFLRPEQGPASAGGGQIIPPQKAVA